MLCKAIRCTLQASPYACSSTACNDSSLQSPDPPSGDGTPDKYIYFPVSVPCGRDSKGLPIGMQLIGDCFKEKDIIRAGYAFECTRKYEMPELAKVSD